jgi:hypothetical protein
MMEVLVKEQVAVQRDWLVSFKLLKWIAEALERSSPQQAGVVLTEGPVAGGTEVIPVIIADVEQVCTPLFLMGSDPMDLPFASEANKDSEVDLGHSSRNEGSGNGNERGGDENKGNRSEDKGSRSEDGSFDGDTMVE